VRAKEIFQLSKDLKSEFPDVKGFSSQDLKYIRKFAKEYEANEIGQQRVDQLPWDQGGFSSLSLICNIPII
jgi:hypothetical protein